MIRQTRYLPISQFAQYADGLRVNILQTALELGPDMSKSYIKTEQETFLDFQAVVFLIGRFALTNHAFPDILINMIQPQSKDLPQLNSEEMEWAEKIRPILLSNAKSLNVPYRSYLSMVYQQMRIDFEDRELSYLLKNHCLNAKQHLSKFALISREKDLRILFEKSSAKIMEKGGIR